MFWHETACTVAGVNFDREKGLGAVPDGEEIEYRGVTVLMRPSMYLRLCHEIDFPELSRQKAAKLANLVRDGVTLAPAYLGLRLKEAEKRLAVPEVIRHDGRHRMMASAILAGDEPMPVQLFPSNMRARHLREDDLVAMRLAMRSEGGTVVGGPIFSDAWLAGELHPSEPARAFLR